MSEPKLKPERVDFSKLIYSWRHKEKGNLVRATPWWGPVGEAILNQDDLPPDTDDPYPRRIHFGAIAQVGWLIETENNIWLGLNLTSQDAFENLGLLTEQKEDGKS